MTLSPEHDKLELSRRMLSPTIKLLGGLLGEVIVEQAGQDCLDLIEDLRRMAKRFREDGEHSALNELHAAISRLDPSQRAIVIKAFSLFFQLANLAEEDYRIQLNRLNQKMEVRDDTLAATVKFARDSGYSLDRLLFLMANIQFKFVWTAHPTEARRLTSMMKLREIYQLLEKLEALEEGSLDYSKVHSAIKQHITLFWQSDDLREEKVHILDEVRANLFYFDHTVFNTLPEILEDLKLTMKTVYTAGPEQDIQIPDFIHFGSWVGGDRDGHPFVTSSVTIQTLLIHKRLCLRKYLDSIRTLIRDLSSSLNQVAISQSLKKSLEEESRALADFAGQTDQLNKHEPYRRKLDFMRVKLENTLEAVEKTAVEFGLGRTLINFRESEAHESADQSHLYSRSREFLSDLELIDTSLRENRGRQIAEGDLARLITQVKIFGFHLAPLDLRQHSQEHWRALDEIFSRAGLPEPMQAAEHFVRAHTGVTAIDAITVESMTDDTVVVRADALRYRVQVTRRPLDRCGPGCTEALATYVKRGITLLNEGPLV